MIVWQELQVMAMVGVFPVTQDLLILLMEELVSHVLKENQVMPGQLPVLYVR